MQIFMNFMDCFNIFNASQLWAIRTFHALATTNSCTNLSKIIKNFIAFFKIHLPYI